MKSLRLLARAFSARRGGSVAVYFGVASFALVATAGLAVDYGRLQAAKARLQEAADSAVLSAVEDYAKQGSAGSAAAATAEARQRFLAMAKASGASVLSVAAQSASDPSFSIALNYRASEPAAFGQLVSLKSYDFSGASTATDGTAPNFVNLFLLVDNSTSMGVGATAGDQRLMNSTSGMSGAGNPGGCMFACHAAQTDALAHRVGAVLRIDAVKSALTNMLGAINGLAPNSHFQVAVATYADDASQVLPLTSDLSAASAAIAGIQLAGPHAGTATRQSLDFVNGLVAATGDGSSGASPLTLVLLATDGTGNSADNSGGPSQPWSTSSNFFPPYSTVPSGPPFPHGVPDPISNGVMELEGLDPDWCEALKVRGVRILTLETPYVLPTASTVSSSTQWELTDPRIAYIRNVLAPIIPGQMEACASQPNLYASAEAPGDIERALQKLLASALLGPPRLTR